MSKCILNVCNILCVLTVCEMVAVGTSDAEDTPELLPGVSRSSLDVMGFTPQSFLMKSVLALINNALVLCFLGLFSWMLC